MIARCMVRAIYSEKGFLVEQGVFGKFVCQIWRIFLPKDLRTLVTERMAPTKAFYGKALECW